MANYYNNFAHTAHHIRKVYILIKDAYFSFFFDIISFYKSNKYILIVYENIHKKERV